MFVFGVQTLTESSG